MTTIGGISAGTELGLDAGLDVDAGFEAGLGEDIDAAIASSPSLSAELARLVEEEGYTIERGQPGERVQPRDRVLPGEETQVDSDDRRIVLGAGVSDPVAASALLADALGRANPDLSDRSFALDVLGEIVGSADRSAVLAPLGQALGSFDSRESPRDFAQLLSLNSLATQRLLFSSSAAFPNEAAIPSGS